MAAMASSGELRCFGFLSCLLSSYKQQMKVEDIVDSMSEQLFTPWGS